MRIDCKIHPNKKKNFCLKDVSAGVRILVIPFGYHYARRVPSFHWHMQGSQTFV